MQAEAPARSAASRAARGAPEPLAWIARRADTPLRGQMLVTWPREWRADEGKRDLDRKQPPGRSRRFIATICYTRGTSSQ